MVTWLRSVKFHFFKFDQQSKSFFSLQLFLTLGIYHKNFTLVINVVSQSNIQQHIHCSSLVRKYKTKLKVIGSDKHSSLSRDEINYSCNLNDGVKKTFTTVIYHCS
jgi:hypothetical protein